MLNALDYKIERENNIIKNIAKEIVLECAQKDLEVSQEFADYMVKIKMLNPKNGFTASEVMPRSLTQQLVQLVVEDLRQDTPAMHCIRMQTYWTSLNLNVADLKKDYMVLMADKAEPHLSELLNLERDDANMFPRLAANYIITAQELGSISQGSQQRETVAALSSVFKQKEQFDFCDDPDEVKIENIVNIARRVTGVRLYLKSVGKAGNNIEDVKHFANLIEAGKEDILKLSERVATRINDIREVTSNVIPMDYFTAAKAETADVNLPPETDSNDVKYVKQILVIMLQHSVYLSDLSSKLEEIDGNANFYLNDFEMTLQKVQNTIGDRDVVPTSEVFEDFIRIGELWSEIKSYFYCVQVVNRIFDELHRINKKEHFQVTQLEKAYNATLKNTEDYVRRKSVEQKTPVASSVALLKDSEDFHLEFNGHCAWTLFFTNGLIVPGISAAGFYQYQDQYYSFANKMGRELWSREPKYYLMEIYEMLRQNPEMIELLNAYDHLYNAKNIPQLVKKVDRKISLLTKEMQTEVHPIKKKWVKNYTFSEWELKMRAIAMTRLVKCVTKSAQTVNHSHFRASIGVLAALDKDKEVQTKRDSVSNHPTVASYLYGLRGQYEDKFRHIELTRPFDESYDKIIDLRKAEEKVADKCRKSQVKKPEAQSEIVVVPSKTTEETNNCNYNEDLEYSAEET